MTEMRFPTGFPQGTGKLVMRPDTGHTPEQAQDHAPEQAQDHDAEHAGEHASEHADEKNGLTDWPAEIKKSGRPDAPANPRPGRPEIPPRAHRKRPGADGRSQFPRRRWDAAASISDRILSDVYRFYAPESEYTQKTDAEQRGEYGQQTDISTMHSLLEIQKAEERLHDDVADSMARNVPPPDPGEKTGSS